MKGAGGRREDDGGLQVLRSGGTSLLAERERVKEEG